MATALNAYPFQTEFRQSSPEEESILASNIRPLSTLESSGNPINQRMASRTLTTMGSSSSLLKRDNKLSTTSTTGSRSTDVADDEDVLIEEKRKLPNSDGYTIHRYKRGRLLGKGGFAKVYLCTALDTNKVYAVKVVLKSNLVKARARQKVRPALQ
jgi:serine/threonine protein kinase